MSNVINDTIQFEIVSRLRPYASRIELSGCPALTDVEVQCLCVRRG